MNFGFGSGSSFGFNPFAGSSFSGGSPISAALPATAGAPATSAPWWQVVLGTGVDVYKTWATNDLMNEQVQRGQYPSISYDAAGRPVGTSATAGISGGWVTLAVVVIVIIVLLKVVMR